MILNFVHLQSKKTAICIWSKSLAHKLACWAGGNLFEKNMCLALNLYFTGILLVSAFPCREGSYPQDPSFWRHNEEWGDCVQADKLSCERPGIWGREHTERPGKCGFQCLHLAAGQQCALQCAYFRLWQEDLPLPPGKYHYAIVNQTVLSCI